MNIIAPLKKYFIKLLTGASYLALVASTSANAGQMQDLRGQRYCEILVKKAHFSNEFQVFNTIGLNECPAELWNKITPEKIKEEKNAALVRLNGPRYWVIDGLKNSSLRDPKPVLFQGLEMRDAALLKLDLIDLWMGQKPYRTHAVKRQTTWIYLAGKPIYELIDAKGKVFVMQSYSVQKTSQTEASLADLANRLQLPKGWRFQTRILKKDAFLTPVDMKAVVVQDDFLNTYQQETPSFIEESK